MLQTESHRAQRSKVQNLILPIVGFFHNAMAIFTQTLLAQIPHVRFTEAIVGRT